MLCLKAEGIEGHVLALMQRSPFVSVSLLAESGVCSRSTACLAVLFSSSSDHLDHQPTAAPSVKWHRAIMPAVFVPREMLLPWYCGHVQAGNAIRTAALQRSLPICIQLLAFVCRAKYE